MKRFEPELRGSGLSPTVPSVVATPLDFISEKHLRERQICAVIDGLAACASFDRRAAEAVLKFMNDELNVRLQDEVEDLFPLLARRCPADDDIGQVITRIRSDLDKATGQLPVIRSILARCLDTGSDIAVEDRKELMRFAGHLQRRLAVENAILLPIAKVRLTKRDLQDLSVRMRSRRGLPRDGETPDAA